MLCDGSPVGVYVSTSGVRGGERLDPTKQTSAALIG